MALGFLIGAAVASKVVSKAYDAYQHAKESGDGASLDLGAIKDTAINGINKMFAPNENNSIANKANMVQMLNDNAAPVTTEYEFEESQQIYCEYCDGLINLAQGNTCCPHCGAAIRKGASRLVVKKRIQKTQAVFTAPQPQPTVYTTPSYLVGCYNCGINVRYVSTDVLRSPSANKAVKARGFKGHTGEVRCPRCGAFLPHYEGNRKF